jgi:DNA-binding GntR family transcriptional regulator
MPAPSNVDVAADAVRDAIVRGRLKPGERIKEIPLAAELDLSRGPIRDALRKLERDGIVQVIPNRGAVVPEIRAVDVLEVYALRAALGSLALHKLTLEGTVPVQALERTLERLRRAVERGQADRAADADLAYQSLVVNRSGLHRVAEEFDRLTWQVRIFIVALDLTLADKLPTILAEMEALHAALVSGAGAEALWREKYERWVRTLVERLPEPFDEPLWAALAAARR